MKPQSLQVGKPQSGSNFLGKKPAIFPKAGSRAPSGDFFESEACSHDLVSDSLTVMIFSGAEAQDPCSVAADFTVIPACAPTAELFPIHYKQLRRLARLCLRNHRDPFFPVPTGLVHEAFLRLADRQNWRGPDHLLGTAAMTMRGLVADHVRKRVARKRGGGLRRLALGSVCLLAEDSGDALTIQELLEQLALSYPRQAKVIQLRFFGGKSIRETAALLEVADATVEADWRSARAWLRTRIGPD